MLQVIVFLPCVFIWTKEILTHFYSKQLSLFFQLRLAIFVPVELIIGFFACKQVISNFLFLIQLQYLNVFIFNKHTQYINKLLKTTFFNKKDKIFQKCRTCLRFKSCPHKLFKIKNKINDKVLVPHSTGLTTNFFYKEHCCLIRLIDYIDKTVSAKLSFLSFFIHVPLNIHMSAQLFFKLLGFHYLQNSFQLRLLLFNFVISQWMGMLSFARAGSIICNCLASSAPVLYRIQVLQMGTSNNNDNVLSTYQKLKLANYYQLVHSKKQKVGVHFGPIGLVTKKSVFDVRVYMFLAFF